MAKTTNILDLNNRLEKVEKENVAQNSYTSLKNKPKINGVTLTGNKTLADLGAAAAADLTTLAGDVGDKTQLNTTDKSSTVAAINEVNAKTYESQSLLSIDSAFAVNDWNLKRNGKNIILYTRNVKDIPNGWTQLGTIPKAYIPQFDFYTYIYSSNKNTWFGLHFMTDGKVEIWNGSGSTISGEIYLNSTVAYNIY